MQNTTAFERFITASPTQKSHALQELQTTAALGLCALASLLENQKTALEPDDLASMSQLIRELATMSAAAVL